MAADAELPFVKILNNYKSSAKRAAALKSTFLFLDGGEGHGELSRHVTTWWLTTLHLTTLDYGKTGLPLNLPAVISACR
jgi:hypothetical protein